MVYQYVAYNESGEVVKGRLNASSEEAATDLLGYAGYRTINLKPYVPFLSTGRLSLQLFQVKPAELVLFFRQLALLLLYLIYPHGMGPGDVKLAALIGLVVGFPMVLVALFIGIFAGGVFAIALLLFRLRGRKAEIPYGTFLATGPVITLLWGNEILAWYLGFF